jgi:hypothetical protein
LKLPRKVETFPKHIIAQLATPVIPYEEIETVSRFLVQYAGFATAIGAIEPADAMTRAAEVLWRIRHLAKNRLPLDHPYSPANDIIDNKDAYVQSFFATIKEATQISTSKEVTV